MSQPTALHARASSIGAMVNIPYMMIIYCHMKECKSSSGLGITSHQKWNEERVDGSE